jgi:hypothetical protein
VQGLVGDAAGGNLGVGVAVGGRPASPHGGDGGNGCGYGSDGGLEYGRGGSSSPAHSIASSLNSSPRASPAGRDGYSGATASPHGGGYRQRREGQKQRRASKRGVSVE